MFGRATRGKIDVTGLSAGTHTVTVTLNLDDTKYTWGEIKVQIVIEKEQNSDTSDGSDSTGSTGGSGSNGSENTGNTGSDAGSASGNESGGNSDSTGGSN